jgi:hypothetical protein
MLNWKHHVSFVSNKIAKCLGVLKKINQIVDSVTLHLMYNALILPNLTYCNIVWGCTYESNLDCLLKLQKKAVQLISKSKFNAHAEPLFNKLKILKIYEINKLQIITLMYTSSKQTQPVELTKFFTRFCFPIRTTIYRTRSMGNLNIPAFRTNIRKFSIMCYGPRLWNSLPESVVNVNSVHCLKKKLIEFFLLSYDG